MNEPKYLLVFDTSNSDRPFVIYEQAVIGGKIGQKVVMRSDSFRVALSGLNQLDGGKPVLLAYSSSPIDNVHDLSRD